MSANLFMKSITHAFLEMELKVFLYNLFLLCYIFLESLYDYMKHVIFIKS